MNTEPTGEKPDYVIHEVDEQDITVDWFFGDANNKVKPVQQIVGIIGWLFTALPVYITVSAIMHRNDGEGFWHYREGFVMFEVTMIILAILLVFFVLGYLLLYFIDRRVDGWRKAHVTYDIDRLDLRLAIAEDLFATKFGPEETRLAQRSIRIEPHADFETYELRDRYRDFEVGVE